MDDTAKLIAFGEKSIQERRRARREALARDLLLKLVENRPGVSTWDIEVNISAAMEYTDKLLAALDEEEPCDPMK